MTTLTHKNGQTATSLPTPVRIFFSLSIAAALVFTLLWAFDFMRNEEAPKWAVTIVAVIIGVGGIWGLFWVANDLIGQLPYKIREGIRPFIFVGPAAVLLGIYLLYPTVNTIFLSLSEDIINLPEELPAELLTSSTIAADLVANANNNLTFDRYLFDGQSLELARLTANEKPVWLLIRGDQVTALGAHNYTFALTDDDMQIAFRNNVLWLIIGTSLSVIFGLVIATLVDRIKREAAAKSFIFLPMAISFVGASVIWRFVYAWQPGGRAQIGLLNALVTLAGGEPIPWLVEKAFNNYALIAIIIWVQTGFCMVVLSAALKGVPAELLEAARIDGASELQIFFRVIIPVIRGAIITVGTTVFIAILKVFDIVYVMTSGKFDTEVIANRMFVEMFSFRNFGRASSLAVILLIVVVPIMVVNIRNLRQQGVNQ